jgi:hypothetical protein
LVVPRIPFAHEFGHALGNSRFSMTGMHGDEYKEDSEFVLDNGSMMNIGSQLRKRHLDYILNEINKMIPDTSFQLL